MQGNERHGAFWLTDTPEEVVFEEYEEHLDVFSVVTKKRDDHFVACLREKVNEPNWRLPVWSDLRPEGIFSEKEDAIKYTKALLKTRREMA